MRIGILTLPLHTNYGGILQAYALQTVLERMGHEVRHLTFDPVRRKGFIKKVRRLLSPLKRFAKSLLPDKLSKDRGRYTRTFCQRYIKTATYRSVYQIRPDDFDAIVVGSDQIWRRLYVNKSNRFVIESSFLDFAEDWKIRRISYAASFGTDKWEFTEQETRRCAELIQKFDAVSVRESSGIELCKQHLNHDAVVTFDPTLLLDKANYEFLINKRHQKNKGIMTYILDESADKSSVISQVQEAVNLPVFKSNVPYNDLDKGKRGAVQPPVENWLSCFRDADFVLTDSFHACVFSIIFNKPFIAILNAERGATRIFSLLKIFKQEYRIVDPHKEFKLSEKMKLCPNCDIETLRKPSLDFLVKALKN